MTEYGWSTNELTVKIFYLYLKSFDVYALSRLEYCINNFQLSWKLKKLYHKNVNYTNLTIIPVRIKDSYH